VIEKVRNLEINIPSGMLQNQELPLFGKQFLRNFFIGVFSSLKKGKFLK